MTSVKYNFSYISGYDNPLVGILLEVNQHTNSWWAYSILIAIFIISSFVFIQRTQDIGKSLLSSTHIVTILSILLFYFGKSLGVTFIDEVVVLGLLTIEALSIAILYFQRRGENQ